MNTGSVALFFYFLTYGKRPDNAFAAPRLEFDRIGDEGTAALANLLWLPNSSLSHLYLLSVGMGGLGARYPQKSPTSPVKVPCIADRIRLTHAVAAPSALAGPLTVNSSLVHVNLAGNSIGDQGATSLATAIEANDSLQHLTLVSNGIGPEGVACLAVSRRV